MVRACDSRMRAPWISHIVNCKQQRTHWGGRGVFETSDCLPVIPLPIRPYLSHCSITLKRHHDQDNSYQRKHFIGAGLQFQRFSPLSTWQGAGWHAGRHGTGEVIENSRSQSSDSKKGGPLDLAWAFVNLKAHLQWHTSSNKAIPLNSFK